MSTSSMTKCVLFTPYVPSMQSLFGSGSPISVIRELGIGDVPGFVTN